MVDKDSKRVARRASPPKVFPPQVGQGAYSPWVLAVKTMVVWAKAVQGSRQMAKMVMKSCKRMVGF